MVENSRSGRTLTARCPIKMQRGILSERVQKKAFQRRSQELGLSRALTGEVNQFLSLSSGLTFLQVIWLLFMTQMKDDLMQVFIIISMGCVYFENYMVRAITNKISHSNFFLQAIHLKFTRGISLTAYPILAVMEFCRVCIYLDFLCNGDTSEI